jgi:transcriptional regulator of acetoin/glycerol metabolism
LGHLESLERVAIMATLTATRGNKKTAAARLGISRATLYRKLRSLDIDLEHLAF